MVMDGLRAAEGLRMVMDGLRAAEGRPKAVSTDVIRTSFDLNRLPEAKVMKSHTNKF